MPTVDMVFVWQDTPGKINVIVPVPNSPIWMTWLERQDASLRRWVDPPGYWVFDESLQPSLNERFIASGWFVNHGPPMGWSTGPSNHRVLGPPTLVPDNYKTLHLLPSAPEEVVKAAYKALMRLGHSDKTNGSDERAKALNEARDAIYKERGW